jgi:Flp pilus assembly protein TadD
VWRNLGQARLALGREAEAESALRRATVVDRDDPELFRTLAAYLLERGRPLEALAPCARLVELLPGDPDAAALLRHAEAAAAAAPR